MLMSGRTRKLVYGFVLLCFLHAGMSLQAKETPGTEPTATMATDQQQTGITASGLVVDENGEPLIGVSVLEQGTSNGTITDVNGRFSLRVKAGSTLAFSYVL